MNARIFNVLALILITCTLNAQVSIIPEPTSVKLNTAGAFKIGQSTVVSSSDERVKNVVVYLQQYLKTNYDLELKEETTANGGGSIEILIDSTNTPEGGYTLDINNKGAIIKA